MKGLTIGELAREAGVGVETIRYYERRGLVEKPPRPPSGYRRYPEDTVRRIKFIKRAQGLGFTLREISELLSLRVDPEVGCAEVKRRAELKIADIDGKIRALEKVRKALSRLSASCRGKGPKSDCPILDYLDAEGEP